MQTSTALTAVQNIESTPITKETIKAYICKDASDQEIVFFLTLCKEQNLNPFLKEAYLVKYGSYPASQIVAKDVFLKRAEKKKDYKGFKAGVILFRNSEVIYQEGAFKLPTDQIIGGWAEVYRAERTPVRIEVAFDEYKGTTKEGKLNKTWAGKPATMIRKVALVQSMREAFPHDFQGMYDESELAAIERGTVIDTTAVAPESDLPPVPEANEKMAKEPKQMIKKIAVEPEFKECISEPQAKRFFAICKKAQKSDDQIKKYLKDQWNISSTRKIERAWYDTVCSWAKVMTEEDEQVDFEMPA